MLELLHNHPTVIDRPQGSHHPRYPEVQYPLDYGYLAGASSGDGAGIDVWLGHAGDRALTGVLLTVDMVKKDVEMKFLVGCTEEDTRQILAFSNQGGMRAQVLEAGHPLTSILRKRQSIRRFLPNPVPVETIDAILELAVLAPSAHNRQPWRFAVLRSPAIKAGLADAMGARFEAELTADGLSPAEVAKQVQRSRERIQQAPVAIILCLDPTHGDVYPDAARQQAEWVMGIQSLAMAGENLLLAAHSQGLGAVWMCAPLFAPEVVRHALDLPPEWEPQGMILLGYPARIPPRRDRRPISEVVRYH